MRRQSTRREHYLPCQLPQAVMPKLAFAFGSRVIDETWAFTALVYVTAAYGAYNGPAAEIAYSCCLCVASLPRVRLSLIKSLGALRIGEMLCLSRASWRTFQLETLMRLSWFEMEHLDGRTRALSFTASTCASTSLP